MTPTLILPLLEGEDRGGEQFRNLRKKFVVRTLMQVLLLHGWAASPKTHWFPYIKRELIKKGIKTRAPRLPYPKLPDLGDWYWVITKELLAMRPPRIVIVHSLGGLALLRVLEEIKIPIALAVFVATPLHLHTKAKPIAKFFRTRYAWTKIRKSIKKAIVIHAKDDHLVPYINGKEIARQLHGKLVMPQVGGHFMVKKFPLLLKILLDLKI